jgi:hypothetical protein
MPAHTRHGQYARNIDRPIAVTAGGTRMNMTSSLGKHPRPDQRNPFICMPIVA